MLKRFLGAASLAALAILPCRADNNNIFPTGPTFQLSGLVWGTTGTASGFNNNFFFTPLNSNENVCVYVFNNNTTSAHSFNASIKFSGDANNKTPSDATWLTLSSVSPSVSSSPSTPANFGTVIAGVSQISLNLSGGTTQAGSPDTANVIIIQTLGTCPVNNPVPSSQLGPGVVLQNSEGTSGVATQQTVTFAALANVRTVIYSVSARCSAGTAQITITQNGATIWSTGAAEVGTTTFVRSWNPGLTIATPPTVITVSSCGAGNSSTLDVQASQFFQQ